MPDTPQGQPATHYQWEFNPQTPLHLFYRGSRDEWTEWFDSEVWAHSLEDLSTCRDLERDLMVGNPVREPVVAVLIEGKLYIWDGHHRVGCSYKYDRLTVPCLIGTPL